jgi:hypothetical protein
MLLANCKASFSPMLQLSDVVSLIRKSEYLVGRYFDAGYRGHDRAGQPWVATGATNPAVIGEVSVRAAS